MLKCSNFPPKLVFIALDQILRLSQDNSSPFCKTRLPLARSLFCLFCHLFANLCQLPSAALKFQIKRFWGIPVIKPGAARMLTNVLYCPRLFFLQSVFQSLDDLSHKRLAEFFNFMEHNFQHVFKPKPRTGFLC